MTHDITEILYRIKEIIKAVEADNSDESLLEEIRVDYLELLELVKLFLISERDSYYGYFLMNMQFRANFYSDSIAGIKLNEFPPVFESNPLLLCKFALKEVLYIVCHEIDHVLLNHPAEMVKANPTGDQHTFYEFNLAADAAVNDRINYEIGHEKRKFMTMPDGAITSGVLKEMFQLKSVSPLENYAYYFAMIKKKSESESASGAQSNGQESMLQKQNEKDGVGSSKDGPSNGQTAPDSSLGEDGRNQVVTAANCGGHLSDHNWESGSDAEDATAVARELINAAVGMMNDESRGLMPGYFMSDVEKINKPPVLSWQAILKKYVGTITAGKRHTRMRLNRRQPERFDLSGTMDEKILKIVVAIDTSGSVSDHMIGMILNEIFAILAKRKHEITVIECDAAVRRVYKAATPADIKQKVTGRGGTLFTPVIEYVNRNKYYRDALLIYFTDGEGEREIPRPLTYRNMWVIIGDKRFFSLSEPYGVVLSIND